MGLSYWIVPPENVTPKLKRFMKPPPDIDLPYELHPVEPHITVGTVPSDTPISLLRSAIPNLSSPLHISFKSVEAGDHYFRSVLIDITNTPALASLHTSIQANLHAASPASNGVNDITPTLKSPRFPHLSLLYIPDAHAADRARVRDTLYKNGSVVSRNITDAENWPGIAFRVGDATSSGGGGDEADLLEGFDAAEIWIVDCEGPTEVWKVVEKVPLIR